VCLTEETTETLYLLGEGHRVVGVSGYTVRPPEARQKPRISSFLHARFDAIEALRPDLILAFSDLQADVTSELIRRGHPVFTFNQRSIADILQMILIVGGLVGRTARAEALVVELGEGLEHVRQTSATWPHRPRVYFEEWNDPLISGIQWVEELVEIAGGVPIYPELRGAGLAKHRVVAAEDVARRDPEVIVASWCGKRVRTDSIAARPGWNAVSAVRAGHIYEIKSALILQPGPAALTDGVRELHEAIGRAVRPN
jgi:iron complex transport system substrate-binding protein